jgi:hypothetical protein
MQRRRTEEEEEEKKNFEETRDSKKLAQHITKEREIHTYKKYI